MLSQSAADNKQLFEDDEETELFRTPIKSRKIKNFHLKFPTIYIFLQNQPFNRTTTKKKKKKNHLATPEKIRLATVKTKSF